MKRVSSVFFILAVFVAFFLFLRLMLSRKAGRTALARKMARGIVIYGYGRQAMERIL